MQCSRSGRPYAPRVVHTWQVLAHEGVPNAKKHLKLDGDTLVAVAVRQGRLIVRARVRQQVCRQPTHAEDDAQAGADADNLLSAG